jgi:hypothetical protein
VIVVTGTRRAGTSLWMQILHMSGLPVIGEAFPGDWGHTLREANPHGFYESLLRLGIYYQTNPHPETGEFVQAHESRRHAVKVFLPGLVRTDAAYLDRVIATVRPWREYEASVRRMADMENRLRPALPGVDPGELHMPPALEWWEENYGFVRDLSQRKYACHVQSFDGLLGAPAEVITRVFDWIGPELCPRPQLERAIAAVRPRTRTQTLARSWSAGDSVEAHVADVFDAYYDAVHAGSGLSGILVERMNEVNAYLLPQIAAAREAVRGAQATLAATHGFEGGGPFWRFTGW